MGSDGLASRLQRSCAIWDYPTTLAGVTTPSIRSLGFGAVMFDELTVMTIRILASLLAGGAIGFERGFHGRPAGFRTHALVCLASALLMLVTVFQDSWMTQVAIETIRTDPARLAQGIMTGIGFLGAGVIFKEGVTVRGLTTAATIWITSAIGILIGIGFYFAAGAGVLATLFVLSGLRWLEARLPRTFHAELVVRFERKTALSERDLREIVLAAGFSAQSISHRLTSSGQAVEYRTTIRSGRIKSLDTLAHKLRELKQVSEYKIMPNAD